MKIEINIDQTNLSGTVEEVFRTLTDEQRTKIAESIMLQFLLEPHNGERAAYVASLVASIQNDPHGDEYINRGRTSYSRMTGDEIRTTDRFKRAMLEYKSTRDKMIELITGAAITTFRAKVTEFVQSDPQLQQVMATTLEHVRENFPKYTHDALMAWFVQGMSNMADGMNQALMQAGNAEHMTKHLTDRLRSTGVNV